MSLPAQRVRAVSLVVGALAAGLLHGPRSEPAASVDQTRRTPITFVGREGGQLPLGGIDGPLRRHLAAAASTGATVLAASCAAPGAPFAIVLRGPGTAR